MKRFVVDASVVIKWVVQEVGSKDALSLRRHELIAPELILPECANILWKKVQRSELTANEAALAAGLLRRSGVSAMSMSDTLEEMTSLAIDINHPAYDCAYLVLARREGVPLVTADTRLANKIASLKQMTSIRALPLGDPATV